MENDEYAGLNQEHLIVKVYKDGMRLKLDDGSVWEIAPGPSTKVICWYPTQRVRVEYEDENYLITNLDTSGPDTVEAKFVR